MAVHWETNTHLIIKRVLEAQLKDICAVCQLMAEQETPIIEVSKSIPLEQFQR
jgi:hypothetical protein